MKPRIAFSELPLRARQLDASELSNVFGGCEDGGGSCEKATDCCLWGFEGRDCTDGKCTWA